MEATSEDGNLTITILEGTTALGEDRKRLEDLEVVVDKNPPTPPKDTNVIGLAYDFGPAGATFDPPITLTWTYDPDDFSGDVADLVLAYYDEEVGEWIELPCTVDPVNHTITASVAHFTTFAIIGTVSPIPPLPPVDKVEPEIIEPVEEPEEEESGIEEPKVTEPVEPEEPDELIVAEELLGWTLLDSILIGIIVVILVFLGWYVRRRLLSNA